VVFSVVVDKVVLLAITMEMVAVEQSELYGERVEPSLLL
jgi:hypothetical protein